MPTEIDLYEQIAQYMNLRYPTILYHFDLSGLWTPSHKLRNLYGRLNRRAWPDLFVAAPNRKGASIKLGLFLELKKAGTALYKLDGVTLRANPHHAEQAAVLKLLRDKGYVAEFAVGFEDTQAQIDEYLA